LQKKQKNPEQKFDNVCSAGKCKIIDDGEYVYADAGHFNPSWLRKNQNILGDLTI
jgi:hypothetical protein